MEKFTIGLAVGALLGMAIIANSQKTRKLFIKSQDEIKSKIDDAIDEKIEMLEDDEDDERPKSRRIRTVRARK
ncbi:MAG: hypothetical protein IJW58_00925 [Clostridia bacterium]|nr:hypothetical protein [Clostridia bacterium]